MKKQQILNYLLENNTALAWEQILISFIATVFLSLFVYFIYKKTHTSALYSKSFNITLVMIAIITAMVMMLIGSNLALSLGMVGALSIIRFRTAVKEAKDSAFLFWAIGIGLSCGTGVYLIALIGSIFIAIVLLLLTHGVFEDDIYLLVVHANNTVDAEKLSSVVTAGTKRAKIKMRNSTASATDITYEIRLGKKDDALLLKQVQELPEVNAVNLVSYSGEVTG